MTQLEAFLLASFAVLSVQWWRALGRLDRERDAIWDALASQRRHHDALTDATAAALQDITTTLGEVEAAQCVPFWPAPKCDCRNCKARRALGAN